MLAVKEQSIQWKCQFNQWKFIKNKNKNKRILGGILKFIRVCLFHKICQYGSSDRYLISFFVCLAGFPKICHAYGLFILGKWTVKI